LAISVNLTDPDRVAGFVNPGSEVAIFITGGGDAGQKTKLLLPRVTVLGVGSTTPVTTSTTAQDGTQVAEQLPRTLLTLAVDQEEAQKVILSSKSLNLTFALLTKDSKVADVPETTTTELLP
jgi:pilus assembly protein CpaB